MVSRINQFHLLSPLSPSFISAVLAFILLPPTPTWYFPHPPLFSLSFPYASLDRPLSLRSHPVWPSGKAGRRTADRRRFKSVEFEPTSFLLLLKKKKVVYGHCLALAIDETLNWLTQLAPAYLWLFTSKSAWRCTVGLIHAPIRLCHGGSAPKAFSAAQLLYV